MDTTALKRFAPAVRRQLMEAVDRKLDIVLNAQTPDYLSTYARQVETLRKLAAEDRKGLVERVAYTWFNRLAALRYLDARGWHPFRVKVLMPVTPEETQPEILRVTRVAGVPEELVPYTDPHRIDGLLDGRIPSADPQGEVYRHLVLAACRYYHGLLPDLFESIDDETELLLPDDLLTEQSVAHGFRTEITDEDCREVEVLGWLYQFYISEKKDEVMARKKPVPSEDIPAVTQLFTPHWIVRYLVENSLGRLWVLNRPDSKLRERMPYYIESEEETDFPRIERPEEIKIIDPAVGSGHMLTYAFDLLYAIYEEEGYAPSEIAGLILEHNLYGIDIDPRAAQLASLALVLKAREKSRRFFHPDGRVRPNIIAMQDVRFEPGELREYIRFLDLGPLFDEPVFELVSQFENAATLGSLIRPVVGEEEIQQLRRRIEDKELGSELFLAETHEKVLRVLQQAEYLTERYHVAVTNPPYMKNAQMPGLLKQYVDSQFPVARANLCTCFLERVFDFTPCRGVSAMILLHGWMFTSRYTQLRKSLLDKHKFLSVLHLGPRGFDTIEGEVVQTAAFVAMSNGRKDVQTIFFDLTTGTSEREKEHLFTDRVGVYRISCSIFNVIEGAPMAYWASPQSLRCFTLPPLNQYAELRAGITTGNNDQFVRNWFEIGLSRFRTGAKSADELWQDERKAWVPLKSGGPFRKWYGNNEKVIRFDRKAYSQLRRQGNHCASEDRYFLPSLTWSDIVGTSSFGVRLCGPGFVFTTVGHSLFSEEEEMLHIASFLCSKVATHLARFLNPTLHTNPGDIGRLPYLPGVVRNQERVRELVELAKQDWDAYETSWDFADFPLLRSDIKALTLALSWTNWKEHCDAAIRRMQELETENNRIWIEAYGLQDELSPEVAEEEITLTRADRRKDMAALLSYAVGCMMGRYSLDKPGLILADAGSTLKDYLEIVGRPLEELSFAPDEDGVIPVLDGEWFEDDIVTRLRDFLRVTFGDETLRENIRFIEESLGKDLRRYFLTDFYKEHLQTYKQRPIYWMVQSPNKGFSALIYLHRYNRDTLNVVLNRYLREYLAKIRSRLEHVARLQADPGASVRERIAARKEADKLTKILNECEEWERQSLLPLAQQRIELDLDDGVKVNYGKLREVLAKVPGSNA